MEGRYGYDAIQSTVAKKHDAATEMIVSLKNQLNLQDTEALRIFFVVPEPRYKEFDTNPVNPLYDIENRRPFQQLENVHIFHVSVSALTE